MKNNWKRLFVFDYIQPMVAHRSNAICNGDDRLFYAGWPKPCT
jgi:hypothetical protein